jgi:UDP-N-acetyl-D-mannosaminuronic acid dehydrogenase
MQKTRVVVVGGCGHVGLPLSLALADTGNHIVWSYDINSDVVDTVNAGLMPFQEPGADIILDRCLKSECFIATDDPSVITQADVVIVVIGTPVDEHLNPDADSVVRAVEQLCPFLRPGQLLVLRSTVFPGVTRRVQDMLDSHQCAGVDVTFCPERIAEGRAFQELYELPQIVSGFSQSGIERASQLFGQLTEDIVVTTTEEAELAKLFTNTWRYIKFAAANQFFMIANDYGLDFSRIRNAITYKYPRALDLPGPGFAAGPCLFKDTMQLAAFNNNNFILGHSSMMINEGMPLYLTSRLEDKYDLKSMTVGILGMAFKGESDDPRSSLSYKLRKILTFRTKAVLCTDEYVKDDIRLVDLDTVLRDAEVLIIAAPHERYRSIKTDKPIIDIWNLRGDGSKI